MKVYFVNKIFGNQSVKAEDIEHEFGLSVKSYFNTKESLKDFIDKNKDIEGYEFLKDLIYSQQKENLIMALTIINEL